MVQGLADKGNPVFIVGHSMGTAKVADWITGPGSDGGSAGIGVAFDGTLEVPPRLPTDTILLPTRHTPPTITLKALPDSRALEASKTMKTFTQIQLMNSNAKI